MNQRRLLDTGHGNHSPDIVDFELRQNAIVIDLPTMMGSAAVGQPRFKPVPPCRRGARRRIIATNNQDGCRSPRRIAQVKWRG
jgi:hypothetical protein